VKALRDSSALLGSSPSLRFSQDIGAPAAQSAKVAARCPASWVEPRLVCEITFLTWTADSLLRHTVYAGLREDKPAERASSINLDRPEST
jgi:ATP-dependent DNA ligase